MLTLRPASGYSLDALAAAFTAGYEGYALPVHLTPAALEAHLATNDIALERSLVAVSENSALVGIALLGIRDERGWVGGVGVAPAWRNQGHGAALMRGVIEQTRALGLHTLQLEVLEHNAGAQRLYERLGFVVTRPLAVYTGPCARLPNSPRTAGAISAVSVTAAHAWRAELAAASPPWQREPATLAHLVGRGADLRALAMMSDGAISAVLMFGVHGADLTLFALVTRSSTPTERVDVGLALLRRALGAETTFGGETAVTVRAVNIPPDDALGGLLQALGCPIVLSQREMRLDLRRT